MNSNEWLREYRNEYVRKVLGILFDKYFIARPKLSRAIGYRNTHIADFMRGAKNLSDKTLDDIESYIFDLYEPLLKDELELLQPFIKEMEEANAKAVKKLQANEVKQ